MKTSKETKNMRCRFFRVTRRKLAGVFGPRPTPADLAMIEASRLDQVIATEDEGGAYFSDLS